MKRFVSFLILTACILVNFPIVFAEDFAVTVESKTAKCGETVPIDISFKNNSGIIAAIFKLTYDKDRLELTGAEDKVLLEGATFSKNLDDYPYTMVWNSATTANFTEDGVLVTLTFKVKENASPGDASINLSYHEDDCFDVNLNNVALSIQNGGITVENAEKKDPTKSHSGGGFVSGIGIKKDNTPTQNTALQQIIFTINQCEVLVFGEVKQNDVAPVIRNDRTMLPARFVAESLGAMVDWNEEEQKVTITKDDIEIILYIDSDIAFVNNRQVKLDSPAFIENDRTYTPLRFIAENLGASVEWDEAEQKVIITKQ